MHESDVVAGWGRAKVVSAVTAHDVGTSFLLFGIWTLGSVAVFMLAYFTQLNYGNEGVGITSRKAIICHNLTYAALVIALIGFVAGIWFARSVVVALIS